MSTAWTIAAVIASIPLVVLLVLLIGFIAYRVVVNDVAGRLRDDAARLPGGPLDPRAAGLQYAAETLERWGRR